MSRSLSASVAALALILSTPAMAQGHDSVFGSLFSRVTGAAGAASTDTPSRSPNARAGEEREREARDIRRGYWERERARLAQQGTPRPGTTVER